MALGRIARIAAAAAAIAMPPIMGVALAQGTPSPPQLLENTGKPITLPFRCGSEDFQWAGLACTESDPCPAYLEIAGVDGAGERIVAAGNFHTDAVTLASVLLASSDGGKTWGESYERIRGAGLDRVQLGQGGSGWVSGADLFPISKNPFLLVTKDGSLWRRTPIFAEVTTGDVLEFQFSKATDGALVVDRGPSGGSARYESYESNDGGSVWRLKDASARPPLPLSPADSGWRVRADAASRSFQVERRSGEAWTVAAAFAIQAGVCTPAPAPAR